MVSVIGVRFQVGGKLYYFDPLDATPNISDRVLVETAKGRELGEVIMPRREVSEESVVAPLKPIIRMATTEDLEHVKELRRREREAFTICQEKIEEHKLEMKLVRAELNFEGNKILFFFTANGRVDFRALVKDLAGILHTRIELRQIGVRDEARMIGGLGPCGRPICCDAFLADFEPVSIKMAKEQKLSLNPTKISGVCGRLMCCLKYEQDQYESMRKRMPRVGKEIQTPDGLATVVELNILKETVSCRLFKGDSSELREYPIEELVKTGAAKADPQHPQSADIEEEAAAEANAERAAQESAVQEPETVDTPQEEANQGQPERHHERQRHRDGRRDGRNQRRNPKPENAAEAKKPAEHKEDGEKKNQDFVRRQEQPKKPAQQANQWRAQLEKAMEKAGSAEE